MMDRTVGILIFNADDLFSMFCLGFLGEIFVKFHIAVYQRAHCRSHLAQWCGVYFLLHIFCQEQGILCEFVTQLFEVVQALFCLCRLMVMPPTAQCA